MISVIMSVYNDKPEYLIESIESIIGQSYKNFEFIIVDDDCDIKISKIINEYAKKFNKIKVIKNSKNLGLTLSLNIAMKQASGKFIARQDADDISMPERLKYQIEFLKNNPDYGLVGCKYLEIENDKFSPQRVKFLSSNMDIRKNISRFNPIFHSSVMFRKNVIDNVGYYNEKIKYAQDYEYWVRISSKYKIKNLDRVLIYRRYSSEMVSIKKEKRQLYYSIKAQITAIKIVTKNIFDYIYVLKTIIKILIPKPILAIIRKLK